jgi:DNA modification methylase
VGMILQKDATEIFLERASVDLFITHPPYININVEEYGNAEKQIQKANTVIEFAKKLGLVIEHMLHALKNTGRILMVLPNDATRIALFDVIKTIPGVMLDREYIWDYSNSPNIPPSTGNEYCFILNIVKSNPYVSDYRIDKYIFDVPWIPSEGLEMYRHLGHTQDAIPEALISQLVQKFSKEGDVVGDLLGGSGTVAAVSKKLNRDYVYNDVSESQVRVATRRLEHIGAENVNREQVVGLMTDFINHMNTERAIQAGMGSEEIKVAIEQSRAELDYVNGLVYDLLVQNGVIK